MSYTNDYKEEHIDELYDWVMDNKHDDINDYCCGMFFEDNYEESVDSYIQEHAGKLWEEFLNLKK